MSAQVTQPVCLVVIDGWGISEKKDTPGDAIYNANTPVMDKLEREYPFRQLVAHGDAVGLPEGLMGNSEVGHLTIGTGRVISQDIIRINKSDFTKEPNIQAPIKRAKEGNGRFHVLGLVSDGGVHSSIDHLFDIIDAARIAQVPQVFIHFFADGRDTDPRSGTKYIKMLQEHIDKHKYGSLATIMGRYYAMDRDNRWERIKVAVDCLIHGKGKRTNDLIATMNEEYKKYADGQEDINNERDDRDENLKPIVVDEQGLIGKGDTLFFINFRSDRVREIVTILGMPQIVEKSGGVPPFEYTSPADLGDESFFEIKQHKKVKKDDGQEVHELVPYIKVPADLDITTMTEYKIGFPFRIAFEPQSVKNTLAEWLSSHGVKQSHVAETEKFAHVTHFFNGGIEEPYEGESRRLIPSPKVNTYDQQPSMSAKGVGDQVASDIASGQYPFVMCNFAPPDMVGHTGNYEKAILGVEATDEAIGTIFEACQAHGYVLVVTADHGNAEKMIGEDGPHTAHTTAPVPFVITSTKHQLIDNPDKIGESKIALYNVAPTVLRLMGLDIPKEMTGKSLLVE